MSATTGIVHGMSNADYHATGALSASGIRELARSPAHFYGRILDKYRPAREPSPAMLAGTLAHCAILEPDALAERYIVRPDWVDGRTKDGKAWLAAVPTGLEIVTAEQMLTAQRQSAAVRALPDVATLLASGRPEVSAFWTDEATGSLCKCRPDWVHPVSSAVILLDVKTAKDASPAGFPRSIANYGYHIQDAWYSDGYALASGLPVLGFVFAVVEAEYPHAAAAYMLDDQAREKGRAECRRLLDLYTECKRTNIWPGYSESIQPIALPAWA